MLFGAQVEGGFESLGLTPLTEDLTLLKQPPYTSQAPICYEMILLFGLKISRILSSTYYVQSIIFSRGRRLRQTREPRPSSSLLEERTGTLKSGRTEVGTVP